MRDVLSLQRIGVWRLRSPPGLERPSKVSELIRLARPGPIIRTELNTRADPAGSSGLLGGFGVEGCSILSGLENAPSSAKGRTFR